MRKAIPLREVKEAIKELQLSREYVMEKNLHQKKLQGFAKFIETQRKLKGTSCLITHSTLFFISRIFLHIKYSYNNR